VTQVGEGHEAAEAAPPVMTFGAPTVGEILAERYQLEEHINDDSAGRQVWRGIDVVLRRPVAVVLRYPGGDSAAEMLQAAVAASRVVHSNLVGVYDAIDEDDRAYVVREWVEGASLRELTAEAPLDADRATSIAHAVASALAAIHATGMVHGNVHPGTVMIGNDGRVVLADARADDDATTQTDVRAVGGVLYFALTGHWPHEEAGASNLPDAVREAGGTIAAPRQMRAGVPTYLDDLAMDLLDARLAPPAADVLAAELGRLDSQSDEFFAHSIPLRFADDVETDLPPEPVRPAGRKIAVGVATLLIIGLIGMIVGIRVLTGNDVTGTNPNAGSTLPGAASPGTTPPDGAAAIPKKIPIAPDQVRIVDPPPGTRSELRNVEFVVDGRDETEWDTERYRGHPNFGRVGKPGMGILIDLREPRRVTSVRVQFSTAGATAELRYGDRDPGNNSAGDRQISQTYKPIGGPVQTGATHAFVGFEPELTYRYLLVWITELPQDSGGQYHIGVQEIIVEGP